MNKQIERTLIVLRHGDYFAGTSNDRTDRGLTRAGALKVLQTVEAICKLPCIIFSENHEIVAHTSTHRRAVDSANLVATTVFGGSPITEKAITIGGGPTSPDELTALSKFMDKITDPDSPPVTILVTHEEIYELIGMLFDLNNEKPKLEKGCAVIINLTTKAVCRVEDYVPNMVTEAVAVTT
jgi:hypothetical protein